MITDEMLAQAAAELADAINASLPAPEECHHQFSAKFERKMKRLIYRTNHPIQHRILRSAASILLVILLGFSSVLAVSVEAREAVFGWVREQYESFYEYFFEGDPDEVESTTYYPGWMPDDYVYQTTLEIDGGEVLIFLNQEGAIAQFTYSTSPENMSFLLEEVECEHRVVSVNGINGDLYVPYDNSLAREIVWVSNDSNTIFCVSALISEDDLLKIAENIEKIN